MVSLNVELVTKRSPTVRPRCKDVTNVFHPSFARKIVLDWYVLRSASETSKGVKSGILHLYKLHLKLHCNQGWANARLIICFILPLELDPPSNWSNIAHDCFSCKLKYSSEIFFFFSIVLATWVSLQLKLEQLLVWLCVVCYNNHFVKLHTYIVLVEIRASALGPTQLHLAHSALELRLGLTYCNLSLWLLRTLATWTGPSCTNYIAYLLNFFYLLIYCLKYQLKSFFKTRNM